MKSDAEILMHYRLNPRTFVYIPDFRYVSIPLLQFLRRCVNPFLDLHKWNMDVSGGVGGNYITYNYNRLRDLVVLGLGRDYIWNSISKTFPIKDIFTKFLLKFFFNFFDHNIFYEFNFISSLWIEPLWVNVIFRMVIFLKSAFNLTYEWVKSPF